jgi:hypothetical protein
MRLRTKSAVIVVVDLDPDFHMLLAQEASFDSEAKAG